MNDDELKRLLQNALAGRRLSDRARARLLGRLRRRPWLIAAAGVAAAALLAAALVPVLRPHALPAAIETSFRGHELGKVDKHGVASDTAKEIRQKIKDATGREIQFPGLRDAGFPQLEAHCCAETGTAHVIYANSWNKLSCFIFEAEKFPFGGGDRLKEAGVDGTSYRKGSMTAVAVREGGIVKLWVSDLRPEQLVAIAVDAEQKRYQLKTTVLTATSEAILKPLAAAIMGISGVEDVETEPSKMQTNVRFDPRRVSTGDIVAYLALNDMDVSWHDEDENR